MSLETVLADNEAHWTGKKLSDDEVSLLRKELPKGLFPSWLQDMLKSYKITASDFSLSDESDLSEMGVEMKWLNPVELLEEATKAYPGLVAIKHGYLPIGMCLEGSGDPYFLKLDQGDDPQVVRIPHDSVADDENLKIDAIEVVSSSLSQFLEASC